MSANTVPATSWSSQLTVYANKHLEGYVDDYCVDVQRYHDASLRSDQLPLGYHARTIAIGTGLVLAAAVETAVLGVFAAASLIVWPVTDKPYKFLAERLDSSSFAIVWNLFRIQSYQKPYLMVMLQNESAARLEIANGRFARDKDCPALLEGRYVAKEFKAGKLQCAMRIALDVFRNPRGYRLDSLDLAQKKILSEYDASKQTVDFIIDVLLKLRSDALPDETRIQLKILDIFIHDGQVNDRTQFQLGEGLMGDYNFVGATEKHIGVFNALKNGTKTKQTLIQELIEVERNNPVWKVVHQLLPERLLAARIDHGAEILADAIFDAHQDRYGDSTYRHYHENYCQADKDLPTSTARALIQGFKNNKPGMEDFVLFRILVNDRQYRSRSKNRVDARPADQVASFFDPSVQEAVGTLLNATKEDLEVMGQDPKTPQEYLPLIDAMKEYHSNPVAFISLFKLRSNGGLTRSFLFSKECWDKAAEIVDARLKTREFHDEKK